jgi:leucyl-tRNA synthetase
MKMVWLLPTTHQRKTSLHKTIKKVAEDIEGFSFNTSVSQFMICVNELSLKIVILVPS